jgi:iron complex outermembrane recepter protein
MSRAKRAGCPGLVRLATALAIGTSSMTAVAQSPPAPAASEDVTPADGQLAEITVTAEHLKENAQTTPISMEVMSSDILRQNQVTDIAGLANFAPDLNFTEAAGSPIITLRGVSSLDTTEAGDPAVTVDFDGFYRNRPYSLNAAMYDIERVEVLRGPQGTLNGRNSVGGSINIVTAKPTLTDAGFASITYGSYNTLILQGMANIPISDTLQVRFAGLSSSHDGYRNNGPQPNADDQDDKSGRISVALEPTSRLTALVTFEYSSQGGAGDAVENIPYIYTASGALDHNLPPGINARTFPIATRPDLALTDKTLRVNATYDAGYFDVTALGGYDETHWHHITDQSSIWNNPSIQNFTQDEFPATANAELRLTSKPGGPLHWQAGTFFFHEDSHLLSYTGVPQATGSDQQFFGFAYSTHSHSIAGYAQASYDITDALTVTAGARYTSDYKYETGANGFFYLGPVDGGYSYQTGSASSSKTTYHGALDYKLTDSNFLYAKVDTGYKQGGFNFGGAPYAPETITSYEAGTKNRFWDNRLQYNLAGYFSNYNKQQVSTFTALANGQVVALTENAGKTHIWGIEQELLAKLPQVGTLNVNIDYLHARYVDFESVADPSDPSLSGNVQLAGNRPPQAPSLSAQIGLERTFLIPSGALTPRIQSKYQSASYFSFYNYPDSEQHAYHLSDFFLTYEHADTKLKIAAYVKNIENKAVFASAGEAQYAVAYEYQFFPPRTYGLRVEKSW